MGNLIEAEMPPAVCAALKQWRDKQDVESVWVFPLPTNPSKACDRFRFAEWLEKAYELAGLPRPQGALWHSIRRKFATERKGYFAKDVAEAGGWKDIRSVLNCYMQADEERVHVALLNNCLRGRKLILVILYC
jgi:hypothetical protein